MGIKTVLVSGIVGVIIGAGIMTVVDNNKAYEARQNAVEQGYRIATDAWVSAQCQQRGSNPRVSNYGCNAFVLFERRDQNGAVSYDSLYRIRAGAAYEHRADRTERTALPASCTGHVPSAYWRDTAATTDSGATCTWIEPTDPRYARFLEQF